MLSYPTHTSHATVVYLWRPGTGLAPWCSYISADQCVGVNPHTLHTKKFIKEILNKIPKKHKLSCHTRLVLLIPTPVCWVKPILCIPKYLKRKFQNKILKKHKLSCHTGVILLIPRLRVGVNLHTLHTKKVIKEILNKIPKKHKLCCLTRLILLMPQLSTYDDHGPVSLPDIYIFQQDNVWG